MANKIKLKRGLKSKLPTLEAGEPAFCPDTRELFVGTGSGNVNMSGSQWYTGTAMSGTSATTGAYSYSACPLVKLGDIYLNTSNGNVYQCTTAGSGSTAKWTYKGCLKGADGAKGDTGSIDKAKLRRLVKTVAIIHNFRILTDDDCYTDASVLDGCIAPNYGNSADGVVLYLDSISNNVRESLNSEIIANEYSVTYFQDLDGDKWYFVEDGEDSSLVTGDSLIIKLGIKNNRKEAQILFRF